MAHHRIAYDTMAEKFQDTLSKYHEKCEKYDELYEKWEKLDEKIADYEDIQICTQTEMKAYRRRLADLIDKVKIAYVVYYVDHMDDYKRVESNGGVVGVYFNKETAYEIALTKQLEECFQCAEGSDEKTINAWNAYLEEFPDPTSWERSFKRFDTEKWFGEPEFTAESGGIRYFVEEFLPDDEKPTEDIQATIKRKFYDDELDQEREAKRPCTESGGPKSPPESSSDE